MNVQNGKTLLLFYPFYRIPGFFVCSGRIGIPPFLFVVLWFPCFGIWESRNLSLGELFLNCAACWTVATFGVFPKVTRLWFPCEVRGFHSLAFPFEAPYRFGICSEPCKDTWRQVSISARRYSQWKSGRIPFPLMCLVYLENVTRLWIKDEEFLTKKRIFFSDYEEKRKGR